MKLNTLAQIVLFMIVIISTPACGPEPQNQKALLYGRWDLAEASRNGNPTESLADLYFEFREDGTMDTNLPVAPGDSKYEMEGSGLRQINGPTELEYTIQELSDSTLVLTTELRQTLFRFRLTRSLPEE